MPRLKSFVSVSEADSNYYETLYLIWMSYIKRTGKESKVFEPNGLAFLPRNISYLLLSSAFDSIITAKLH